MKYSKHTLLVGDDGGPLHGATRGTAHVGCGGTVAQVLGGVWRGSVMTLL